MFHLINFISAKNEVKSLQKLTRSVRSGDSLLKVTVAKNPQHAIILRYAFAVMAV